MHKANPRWPLRRVVRRKGASPEFAKAMARAEFGRFYTDDSREQEVRRSLERAKRRGDGAKPNGAAPPAKPSATTSKEMCKAKPRIWRQPSVKERRSEIAEGISQLRQAAKRRR